MEPSCDRRAGRRQKRTAGSGFLRQHKNTFIPFSGIVIHMRNIKTEDSKHLAGVCMYVCVSCNGLVTCDRSSVHYRQEWRFSRNRFRWMIPPWLTLIITWCWGLGSHHLHLNSTLHPLIKLSWASWDLSLKRGEDTSVFVRKLSKAAVACDKVFSSKPVTPWRGQANGDEWFLHGLTCMGLKSKERTKWVLFSRWSIKLGC